MMALLIAITASVVTASLGYLMIVAAAAVAGAISRGGRRERAADAYQALAVSRFTIPVSVIVPVDGDCETLSDTIEGLLGLNYPEIEVVVVAESMPDRLLAALKHDWALEPKELFYRRTLHTSPVRRIFSSDRDERLVIIEKDPACRADALNCGVSFARYRYVVSVSPDIAFDSDALLRLMSPALRDPGAVLAVTSYVERRPANGSGVPSPDSRLPSPDPRPPSPDWIAASDDYQRLASIRSWMASRLAWHQVQCGLPPRDGVTAWRRDAVMELGGFSTEAADAELDLLVRLQTSQSDGPSGRVVRTSEVFGHTGTLSVQGAAALAARRQSALLQALKTFRAAPGSNPARRTMKIVVGVELMTSAAQGIVAVLVIVAALAGWVSWRAPYLTFLLLTFGYAVVSASALLLRGGTPGAPSGDDLKRLLLRAPLEFAVYRPTLLWARLVANR
jgi:glycosyltransferase involved in cell wall biosynthesis